MIRLRRLSLAACLTLVLISTATAGESLVNSGDLREIGYFTYWDADLDIQDGESVSTVYLLDDNLYVVGNTGYVHAVHTGVGLTRWFQHLSDDVYPIMAPDHFVDVNGKPLVVFSTRLRAVIVDRYTGEVVSDMAMKAVPGGSAIADEDSIYFGSTDGHMYAIKWSDPRAKQGVMKWRVITGGPVTTAGKLVNEMRDLVFASESGRVFSCTTEAKLLNWKFDIGEAITANPVVTEAGTFVACTNRSLYRIDTVSGVQRWRVRFPELLKNSPVLVGSTIYQYCPDEGVTALDADSGNILWKCEEADSFLSCDDGYVHLLAGGNKVLKLDAANGKVVRSISLPRKILPVCNTVDSTIYMVTEKGQLVCAKPMGTPRLTPSMMKVALRDMHRAPAVNNGDKADDEALKRHKPQSAIDMNDPLRSGNDVPPLGGMDE